MRSEAPCTSLAAIEAATQTIGHALLAAIRRRRWAPTPRRMQEHLLARVTRDPQVRAQLLRLVDVLPVLDDPTSIARHLHEYLGEADGHLSSWLWKALALAAPENWAGRTLGWAARRATEAQARRFIAGTSLEEIVEAARRTHRRGMAFTLDLLGEAVTSAREADAYLAAYIQLIEQMAPRCRQWPEVPLAANGRRGPLPRVNVSLKLSALDPRFDPLDPEGSRRRVSERLAALLRVARRQGAFVNVDMESYQAKELTHAIFRRVLDDDEFRDLADVGIVVQAYLRDSGDELESLAGWAARRGTPIWVRLVKGAYWDYETTLAASRGWPVPVFEDKSETDANFERLTRRLMQLQPQLRCALASHNVRSLAHGLAVAEALGVPSEHFEVQLLYGMADELQRALVERGQRVRLYMPFGRLIPGMAYLVRRLLENTSNSSFLLQAQESIRSDDELLAPPGRPDRPAPRPAAAVPLPSDKETFMSLATPFRNEPPADFSRPETRQAMAHALADVHNRFGRDWPLWINGRPLDTAEWLTSVNASHRHQVLGRVARADRQHADQAVAAAKEALGSWHAAGARARGELLLRAAEIMRRRRFELAAWVLYEAGKGWRDADADVAEAIDFCEYYARAAAALDEPRGVELPGESNRFEYWPRGVAAVIAPWNFPLAILTGMTAAALATGNPVVMKPAEQTSLVACQLAEVFREAGLPPGVLHLVPGAGDEVGARLVEHPDVALIVFTGSREVGLAIHRRAAEVSAAGIPQVKHVIAEMGGKNAILVAADADLDEAVVGILASAFGYQGQKCSACSRVIALAGVHDALVERLVEAARSLEVGPAEEPGSHLGPIIDGEAHAKITRYLALARQEGHQVLGVEAPALVEEGYYCGPHIVVDVAPEARVAQEEVFGPLLVVHRAADLDEAIRIANGTPYALTAGIYSRSPAVLDEACRRLAAGNVYLNRPITGALVGRQPFGGFRLSGLGSQAGGPDYLLQFVVPRTISENTLRRGFAPPPPQAAEPLVAGANLRPATAAIPPPAAPPQAAQARPVVDA